MTSSHTILAALLASSAMIPAAALAETPALPTGGSVAAGAATIGTPNAGALAITQTSRNAVINWRDFSVGAGGRVDIVQPGRDAALLNRVTGGATSTIAGQISANGQVYLVNPNGIAITATGSVNAGAFVASTLGITDDDFMAGKRTFAGAGGSVVNQGTISIVSGGYAALIGGAVDNAGLIVASLGSVGLAAGGQATLDFTGDGFLQVALPTDGGAITMAGRISADGGRVILTAASAHEAARATVNLSGVIEAKGVEGHSGAVTLTGGDVTLVGATIDVSGAAGGGSVRIGGDLQGKGALAHADTLTVDAATRITADATGSGKGGSVVLWSDGKTDFAGRITAKGAGGGVGGDAEVSGKRLLAFTGGVDLTGATAGTLTLDPFDLTIADQPGTGGFHAIAEDSVIDAQIVRDVLAGANVTIETGEDGAQVGNIALAAPLGWTSGNTLTLAAAGGITLGGAISAANGGLTLKAGGTITAPVAVTLAHFTLASGDWVQNAATLPAFSATDFRVDGGSFLRAIGGDGTTATPYLLTDIYGLQGIGSAAARAPGALSTALMAASFALANDIDASATAGWSDGAGFLPIGFDAAFTGSLDGAGHTVTGLVIDRPTEDQVAPFGNVGAGGTITNVRMEAGSVTGNSVVAGLAAVNGGALTDVSTSGTVASSAGLAPDPTDGLFIGDLVGMNQGAITRGVATGAVSGIANVGGLVGGTSAAAATVTGSRASGSVAGVSNVGGLVGYNAGTVTTSHADGIVRGVSGGATIGGLVGENVKLIDESYAAGVVDAAGANIVGGLVGGNDGRVQYAYAIGSVTGGSQVGGLIGQAGSASSVAQTYATGAVTGTDMVGGFAGSNRGQIGSSYWDMGTTGQAVGVADDMPASGSSGLTGLTTAQGHGFSYAFDGNWYQYADMRPILRAELDTTNVDADGAIRIANAHQLQLIDTNTGATYRLVADIDATATSGSNAADIWGPTGFKSLGGYGGFAGTIDGAGHSITGLTMVHPNDSAGLVMQLQGSILDLHLIGGSITGSTTTGALAGQNYGLINRSSSSATVIGGSYYVGGLAGLSTASGYGPGVVEYSSASGNVSGGSLVGGLVGYTTTAVVGSFATGSVTGEQYVGGLIGNASADVTDSYATGAVTGQTYVGGLVGQTYGGMVANSYATGDVTGSVSQIGGLIGRVQGDVTHSFATGKVSATTTNGDDGLVGGLIGVSYRGAITQSYATGAVDANAGGYAGGLVGGAFGTTAVADAYSTGSVHGGGYVGGLVGFLTGSAARSYSTGSVAGAYAVGGSVGTNYGGLTNVYWNTTTAGQASGVGDGSGTGATGLTTAAMQDLSAYRTNFAGFDFVDIWSPPNQVGQNDGSATAYYPELYSLSKVVALASDATTRLYGDANPALSGVTISGLPAGDAASFAPEYTAIATVTSDVGSYGYTIANATVASAPGAYRIVNALGDVAVTARPLVIDGSGASRSYGSDNPTDAFTTSAATSGGLVNGDAIGSVDIVTPGLDRTTGVGNYATLLGNAVFSSGKASNYLITYAAGDLTITPRALTITPYNVSTIYSGNGNLPLLSYTVGGEGLVNGDTLSGGLTSDAGAKGNAGVYAITRGTLAASANYALSVDAATWTIIPRFVVGTLKGVVKKTYDGTNQAVVTQANIGTFDAFTYSPVGFLPGDDVKLSWTGAEYGTRNAGTGLWVYLTGKTLSGADAANYQIGWVQGQVGTINPKALRISAAADTKTYDATTQSHVLPTVAGLVSGDAVYGLSQAFDSANAGTRALTVDGGYVVADQNGGHNYTITVADRSGKITPASLILRAQSDTRVYDGTTASALTPLVTGLQGSDSVAGLAQGFSSTSAGVRTLQVASGWTVSDGNAGANYKVTTQSAVGEITRRALTVSLTGMLSKVYDGTTIAKVDASNYVLTNLVGTDAPTLSYSATYDTDNAGTGKLVTLSSMVLRGAGSGNYTLTATSLSAAIGSITPRALRLIAVAASKAADGTTTVFGTPRATGLVGGDTISGLAEFYDGAGVGAHIIAIDPGYTIADGNGGANYNVTLTSSRGRIQ